MTTAARYFVGIDVGTGSARAGVFNADGHMLASAKRDIAIFHETGNIVEQSGNNIWNAICASVREAVEASGVLPSSVVGIGVDATCSLVVVGKNGKPLAVGPSEDHERNIIVWMDHRAAEQARRITRMGHDVLRYVGGTISPEMETPKLLWLKENRPETFDAAEYFFDLADYITWRASGSLARSSCTVTCKWTYLAHEHRWDPTYFRAIGLDALADEGFARIGTEVVSPGTRIGGLTEEAADQLGLPAGTAVGSGLIDAHAGGVGTVGALGTLEENMAYVFGTSSCTMTTTQSPAFVPGVWGPYFDAMVPGFWLNEGGQSAAGAAIDRLVSLHPASGEASKRAAELGLPLLSYLSQLAIGQSASASDAIGLADGVHVVPEFLGNRAPLADPDTRAVIAGLGMDQSEASLVALYVAGLSGIGYGLRQIIEIQEKHGAPIKRIVISGGAGQDNLVRQILADTSGVPVVVTEAKEPVLLGSAILASMAAGHFPDLTTAMSKMTRAAAAFEPNDSVRQVHEKRFAVFVNLQAIARSPEARHSAT
ncbi:MULTISPECIES: FGGY-family carbohydrate kinase [unclassified Devosia]|uniref:FGGY-family carbohydrate kinase n=1 Tax=unclassified Devosia TaxID=196773 RepID=UPI000AE1DC6B|nr:MULTISPECIES: FGGY-family carbohydrate kinase [unclassified Devosia]